MVLRLTANKIYQRFFAFSFWLFPLVVALLLCILFSHTHSLHVQIHYNHP